jgi:anti-sigma-K factor RskA
LFADIGHTSALTRKLRFWQAGAVGLAAAAAAAAFVAFSPNLTEPVVGPGVQIGDGSVLTADVSAQDASLRIIAVYQPATGELSLNRTAGSAPSQRDLELWAIIGEDTPTSLGVLPAAEQVVITIPDHLRASFQTATLAITDEPLGGSPTGVGTGAVLAVGSLTSF